MGSGMFAGSVGSGETECVVFKSVEKWAEVRVGAGAGAGGIWLSWVLWLAKGDWEVVVLM